MGSKTFKSNKNPREKEKKEKALCIHFLWKATKIKLFFQEVMRTRTLW